MSDVRCGAQVQLPQQAQLPAQPSNIPLLGEGTNRPRRANWRRSAAFGSGDHPTSLTAS